MVMAQSLFKLIKMREPDSTLDVLAPAWTFSLLEKMPEVSRAIEMPFKHGELKLTKRFQLARQLRANQYDQAIVLPNSLKSALIPWFAGIPKRTGWLGEQRYILLNDHRRLDENRYPLMIEQFMALGLPADETLSKPYPYPTFQITKAAQEVVLQKYKPLYRGRPILLLCPGAAFGPSKRWPESYFAEVANQKIADGWDVWISGSKDDKPVTENIMALTQQRCENIPGEVGLAEIIDLMSLVAGVVTNDSGLMHIAAALKKPIVALYGSTSPTFTPPLADDATVLKLALPCQPCFERQCPLQHHRCMRDLMPERVLNTISTWRV